MSASLSLKTQFEELALYNRWANARLYADAASLSREALQRDVGVYFRSLFGTLVHLLQADRTWSYLLGGGDRAKMVLPAAPTDFESLRQARRSQDEAFVAWVRTLDEAWLAEPFSFVSPQGTWKGYTYSGTHASTLAHVFNHQTHHRGQAHAALTRLGIAEPLPLDLVIKGFLGE
jgi:uncharacterized damage-inducible protein DinB